MLLYNGDCFEEMTKIHKELDLILVDPPYGTIKDIELKGYSNQDTSWDDRLDIAKFFNHCNKLLRVKGYLIVFSQEPYTSQLRSYKHENLFFLYDAVWVKDHFANNLIAKKALVKYHEDISIFCKKYDSNHNNPVRLYVKYLMSYINVNRTIINHILGHRKAEHFLRWDTLQFELCSEDIYQELINVFHIDKAPNFWPYFKVCDRFARHTKTFNIKGNFKGSVFYYKKDYVKVHPTQKPIRLLEDIITTFSNEGDTVLDFCFGSGGTGIACANTKRFFIGIEKDIKYFDQSIEWIKKLFLLNESAIVRDNNSVIIDLTNTYALF